MAEVSVTLRFKNQEDRDYFMAGLNDGFGENHCMLDWPYDNWSKEDQRSGVAFHSCDTFDVEVFRPQDYNEEEEETS